MKTKMSDKLEYENGNVYDAKEHHPMVKALVREKGLNLGNFRPRLKKYGYTVDEKNIINTFKANGFECRVFSQECMNLFFGGDSAPHISDPAIETWMDYQKL